LTEWFDVCHNRYVLCLVVCWLDKPV
jgi:hypothetical protein